MSVQLSGGSDALADEDRYFSIEICGIGGPKSFLLSFSPRKPVRACV
jgi:hypothetical protein